MSKATPLLELWRIAVRAKADAGVAAARADRLAAEFNEALAIESAERGVIGGYQIDYLGDGKVKPIAECRLFPAD